MQYVDIISATYPVNNSKEIESIFLPCKLKSIILVCRKTSTPQPIINNTTNDKNRKRKPKQIVK